MNSYRSLLGVVPGLIAESPGSYYSLTERHLQALWLEQKYFKGLATSTGLPIRVVSPGLWNADAGPDFLQAHLEIGGTIVKGDVEIHLSEASWVHHQHHADARYNNVVLHLALWQPRRQGSLRTQDKQTFYSAYLEPFLTVPPNRLINLIDLELYPYKKFLGSGRCSKQLFKELTVPKTAELLADASAWRLSQKLAFIKEQTPNPRLWMGVGVAMALGYKRNAAAFMQLYLWLNKQEMTEERAIFAACLKACGFFSESYRQKWGSCPEYAQLLRETPAAEGTPSLPLNMLKIRPFNHPLRRLAYLAKFTADASHYALSERLFGLWDSCWPELKSRQEHTKLRHRLSEMLPVYTDEYFNSRYTFSGDRQEGFLPLIGQDIKQTILVNAFMPMLADRTGVNSCAEREALSAFFASFPAEDTSKTKYLTHRFFGDTPKGSLLANAALEQGAYQIHRDFCIHYEASCDGCPFVERYQAGYIR